MSIAEAPRMLRAFGKMRLSARQITVYTRGVRENLLAYARARLALRPSNNLGDNPRCYGDAHVENRGSLRIGRDFVLGGALGTVHLTTAAGALMGIGDGVTVEYGSSITAHALVSIGHRVRIGPHSVVSDGELPLRFERASAAVPRGIMIGDDVWIGTRVTITAGVRIGARAVIAAGSVVTQDIDDDALAEGNPATMFRIAPPRSTRSPRRIAAPTFFVSKRAFDTEH